MGAAFNIVGRIISTLLGALLCFMGGGWILRQKAVVPEVV